MMVDEMALLSLQAKDGVGSSGQTASQSVRDGDYKDFTLGSESCKMIYIRFDDEDKEYVFGATKCTKTKGGTVVERSVVEKAVVEGTNGSGNVNEIDTEDV